MVQATDEENHNDDSNSKNEEFRYLDKRINLLKE